MTGSRSPAGCDRHDMTVPRRNCKPAIASYLAGYNPRDAA